MSELIVVDECKDCGARVSELDNFCRKCGLSVSESSAPPLPLTVVDAEMVSAPGDTSVLAAPHSTVVVTTERSSIRVVLENRFYVMAILLCAGPIGLPALWFSHRFSRRCKIITTTAYFLVTVVLPIAVLWYCLDVAVRPLVDVLGR